MSRSRNKNIYNIAIEDNLIVESTNNKLEAYLIYHEWASARADVKILNSINTDITYKVLED